MIKRIILLLLIALAISCAPQRVEKDEQALALEEDIDHIEISKMCFFAEELIQLAVDTGFQSRFKNVLKQHDNVRRKTEGDRKEYSLTLHILNKSIASEKNYAKENQSGKKFLLDLLNNRSEINFLVDENLIIQQVDATTRSMVNGYDEGTVEESSFIFFCYNPLLYKSESSPQLVTVESINFQL